MIRTAVAFLLFFRLIAEVRPARASVITYINPAVAVAIGVSVLGERLTPAMLGAFVLPGGLRLRQGRRRYDRRRKLTGRTSTPLA